MLRHVQPSQRANTRKHTLSFWYVQTHAHTRCTLGLDTGKQIQTHALPLICAGTRSDLEAHADRPSAFNTGNWIKVHAQLSTHGVCQCTKMILDHNKSGTEQCTVVKYHEPIRDLNHCTRNIYLRSTCLFPPIDGSQYQFVLHKWASYHVKRKNSMCSNSSLPSTMHSWMQALPSATNISQFDFLFWGASKIRDVL